MTTQKEATTKSYDVISPPIARRDEDLVCFAGVAPPGWDAKMPRQSNDSTGKCCSMIQGGGQSAYANPNF